MIRARLRESRASRGGGIMGRRPTSWRRRMCGDGAGARDTGAEASGAAAGLLLRSAIPPTHRTRGSRWRAGGAIPRPCASCASARGDVEYVTRGTDPHARHRRGRARRPRRGCATRGRARSASRRGSGATFAARPARRHPRRDVRARRSLGEQRAARGRVRAGAVTAGAWRSRAPPSRGSSSRTIMRAAWSSTASATTPTPCCWRRARGRGELAASFGGRLRVEPARADDRAHVPSCSPTRSKRRRYLPTRLGEL